MIDVAFNVQARTGELNFGSRVLPGNNFQYIADGYRVEYRFKIMKSIGSFGDDIKAEVDFAIGKREHSW
jgi:hypothetical protein